MKKKKKSVRVHVSFKGLAAAALRRLHKEGLCGATMRLVVEGLVLAKVREEIVKRDTPLLGCSCGDPDCEDDECPGR